MTALQNRLAALLTDKFGIPKETLGPEVPFEELELDSLILIEFALILSREFGVPLEDWELNPRLTLRATADLLESKGVAV